MRLRATRSTAVAQRGQANRRQTYLVIAAGESNSGGFAPNADLTPTEAAPRSVVQIWNVSTNQWQDLDIGTNNNLDHNGLNSTSHSIENELANAVAAGRFNQLQVYYLQTGQGGSLIAEWDVGAASGYWEKFVSRFNAAMAAMPAGVSFVPVIYYTQGINDGVRGQAAGPWKTATIAHLAKIRALVGPNTLIVMTKFRSIYGSYNTAIDEIVAADSNCRAIQTRDSTGLEWQPDGNHWTYLGMKSLCQLFIDAVLGASVTATPTISPSSGEYGGAQTVTISGVGTIRYSTDVRDPNIGTPYAAPFSAAVPGPVEARAWEPGKASSVVAAVSYTSPSAIAWNATEAATNSFSLTGGGTIIESTLSSWLSCRSTGAERSSGKWYFEFVLQNTITNAGTMWGLANATHSIGGYLGASNHGLGVFVGSTFKSSAFTGSAVVPNPVNALGLTIGIHVDFGYGAGVGAVWVTKNNAPIGAGDAAAGTSPDFTFNTATTGPLRPAIAIYGYMSGGASTAGRWLIKGGASTTYAPASGFSGW